MSNMYLNLFLYCLEVHLLYVCLILGMPYGCAAPHLRSGNRVEPSNSQPVADI